MLTRHAKDPKVLRMCFKAVTNIAYHSKSNKHALLSLHHSSEGLSSGTSIIDLIFATIETFQKDPVFLVDALTCVRTLMNVGQGRRTGNFLSF